MDKDFLDKINRYRKLVNDVGNLSLLIDCEEKIDGQVYDGQDLLNACLIFNHVAGNIIISRKLSAGSDVDAAGIDMEKYGKAFRELIKEYIGLDMHELAKESVAE